ncbi:MAG: 5-(carboxyamino)imidazole ribonucleotide synthase [Cardiobacteriaceae bacterium]|nr:5-(carboxyamino)imidazole ribonucleotide synthase [Cardiobacteriaceae bacterium]
MNIGILGGGQLGRMFLQVAHNYPDTFHILDPDPHAPSRPLAHHFIEGDFRDEQTVLDFGRDLEAIGIEIEQVNVKALYQLEAMGKRVIPRPNALTLIQDKGLQKQFYAEHQLATAPFILFDPLDPQSALEKMPLPFVQKTRTGGYDGKGVQIIRTQQDLEKLWQVPSVLEQFYAEVLEIAVVVVRGDYGYSVAYPAMEMIFDPEFNLVDFVQMPAPSLSEEQQQQARSLALSVVQHLDSAGVFAVEMFVTPSGEIVINETACRVHNSAHITIEACESSQFDQMYRVIRGLPLGSTTQHKPAAMLNLVGISALDLPLDELMNEEAVYVHWYGKTEARVGRKMGHITLLAESEQELYEKIRVCKESL